MTTRATTEVTDLARRHEQHLAFAIDDQPLVCERRLARPHAHDGQDVLTMEGLHQAYGRSKDSFSESSGHCLTSSAQVIYIT